MRFTNLLHWLETHAGLGSWLQAVGTIAAVWFAFFQITADRRASRRRLLVTVEALRTAIGTTLHRLDFCERELGRAIQTNERSEVRAIAELILPDSGLPAAIAWLRAVSLHEVHDWQIVYAVAETRAYLDKAFAHLEDLAREQSVTNPMAFSVAVRGVERGRDMINSVYREMTKSSIRRLRESMFRRA
jgi:hypothetical protein